MMSCLFHSLICSHLQFRISPSQKIYLTGLSLVNVSDHFILLNLRERQTRLESASYLSRLWQEVTGSAGRWTLRVCWPASVRIHSQKICLYPTLQMILMYCRFQPFSRFLSYVNLKVKTSGLTLLQNEPPFTRIQQGQLRPRPSLFLLY